MSEQSNKIWTVGSCFAGIGGFELGLQWAFDEYGIDHEVKWQIEQNAFCQRILKKRANTKIILKGRTLWYMIKMSAYFGKQQQKENKNVLF